MTGTYSISEVATMLDVALSALRYYETEGLLPAVG
jgi:DNA-binding transcriptional MerR regulator